MELFHHPAQNCVGILQLCCLPPCMTPHLAVFTNQSHATGLQRKIHICLLKTPTEYLKVGNLRNHRDCESANDCEIFWVALENSIAANLLVAFILPIAYKLSQNQKAKVSIWDLWHYNPLKIINRLSHFIFFCLVQKDKSRAEMLVVTFIIWIFCKLISQLVP